MTGAGPRPPSRPQTRRRRSFGRCRSFPTTQVCLVLRRPRRRRLILPLLCSTPLHPLPLHWRWLNRISSVRATGKRLHVRVCDRCRETPDGWSNSVRMDCYCVHGGIICASVLKREIERVDRCRLHSGC